MILDSGPILSEILDVYFAIRNSSVMKTIEKELFCGNTENVYVPKSTHVVSIDCP